MKKIRLITLIAFILAALALLMSSCNSVNGADNTDKEAETTTEPAYKCPSLTDYAVIRAEDADSAVIKYAAGLRVTLAEETGGHTVIAYAEDINLRDDVKGKSFILVGDTVCTYTAADGAKHNYTDDAKKGLGDNEYAIQAFEDGTVAIVATSSNALGLAIDKFTADLIDNELLVLSSATDRYTGIYEAPPRYEYSYETDVITIADDAPTDMPVMYIVTENEVRPSSVPRNQYINATFALDGMGFVDDVPEMSMQIKGRGNYSWSFPKKPYNFKFEEKVDLGGLGAAKKWTLVTTYSDKTMTRNYIALTLGLDLGMDYGTECFFVNVYFNGEYRGVYLVTERVEVNKERVNIDIEEGSAASMWEIEMTYRHSETNTHITLGSGVHLMLREPEPDDKDDKYDDATVDSVFDAAKIVLKRADAAMKRGYDDFAPLINVDSFINWYIVNEFVKNYDSRFVTSCFCFIDDDGILWMGPPWDYDTCMGNQNAATCMNPVGWHVAEAGWYQLLLKDETFWNLLCERWAEIRDDGIILDDYIAKINNFVADHAQSIEANYVRWPDCLLSTDLRGGDSTYTYEDEIEYLENWLTKRTAWLDEQFGYKG